MSLPSLSPESAHCMLPCQFCSLTAMCPSTFATANSGLRIDPMKQLSVLGPHHTVAAQSLVRDSVDSLDTHCPQSFPEALLRNLTLPHPLTLHSTMEEHPRLRTHFLDFPGAAWSFHAYLLLLKSLPWVAKKKLTPLEPGPGLEQQYIERLFYYLELDMIWMP